MDGKGLTHDHLFKLLLEQPGIAGALLRERLPAELVARLAEVEPEVVPGTFVSERLRERQSDRLFRVRLVDGEAAYLYCLVEHKSAPDPRIGLQLLGYLAAIWEQLARDDPGSKLPMVVPLVVYHGASRWGGPRRFGEGVAAEESVRPHLLDFPFEVLDVGHVEVPALSAEPRLRGGLLLLRYSSRYPDEDPIGALARMLENLRGMSDAFLSAAGFYMFRQYARAHREELRAAIRRALPEKEEQMLSRAVEETLAEGRAQGRAEGQALGRAEGQALGRAEGQALGRVQGKALSLLRLLERKLGPLSSELTVRVQHASEAEIDAWTDRVLDAKSVEGVFGAESP